LPIHLRSETELRGRKQHRCQKQEGEHGRSEHDPLQARRPTGAALLAYRTLETGRPRRRLKAGRPITPGAASSSSPALLGDPLQGVEDRQPQIAGMRLHDRVEAHQAQLHRASSCLPLNQNQVEPSRKDPALAWPDEDRPRRLHPAQFVTDRVLIVLRVQMDDLYFHGLYWEAN